MPSTYFSAGPVNFAAISQVTATLGANDPSLGTRLSYGGNDYVFAYNDCNSVIPVGVGTVLQSGATGMSITLSSITATDLCVGVVKHESMATGTYGWLLTKGFGTAQMAGTSASVSVNVALELGVNGLFTPRSNTTLNGDIVGKALAAIVTGASGAAYFSVF